MNHAAWLSVNRKRVIYLFGASSIAFLGSKSFHKVPPNNMGVLQYWDRSVAPGAFGPSDICISSPFSTIHYIRTKGVWKRLVYTMTSKEGHPIEMRLLIQVKPKLHAVPEIYIKFGDDYARAFLEQEFVPVVKNYISQLPLSEICSSDARTVNKIHKELIDQLNDAAVFHNIIINSPETDLVFLDPKNETL